MNQQTLKRREPLEQLKADELLADRYRQLMHWAMALTRGDAGKAEEVVQEFCLYFTLVKPDLSGVANLDGYLYTCLRNIYRSGLARASREALHFVSIEDFDSFAFAISAHPAGDPLQRQNDLRRICTYAVWRKEVSKSASYFILHFFHGYGRQEIAELARLPISAIYNKLKTARGEIKSYLEEPEKLRLANRDAPPAPALSWSLLSTGDLFRELRQRILQARCSECLPEEELLAIYRSAMAKPISCSLLAHIVSCARCLSLVDRHLRRPTLNDREPLDLFGFSSQGGEDPASPTMTFEIMLRSLEKTWGRTYEHRPRTLSLALDGQVIAYHEVRADYNRLSARIEHLEKAQFIEVFSEQQVRLALLAVNEPPPAGLSFILQRVALSDARWLELSLSYDGFGLYSEVAYFDSALSTATIEEPAEETPVFSDAKTRDQEGLSGFLLGLGAAWAILASTLRTITPSPAVAWAFVLAVVISTASYFTYRHAYPRIDGAQILNQSIRLQGASLQGQTEHQVLRIEESSSDGVIIQRGEVDLWRDGNGSRYIRRLYDAQHQTLAVEWQNKNTKGGSRIASSAHQAPGPGATLMNESWDQDLSAQAFAAMGDAAPQIRAMNGGYELTRVGPTKAQPHLVSATLVLDRQLQPIRQTMRVRNGEGVQELRFVQANLERRPSRSVPDAVFSPESELLSPAGRDRRPSAARAHNLLADNTAQLAELEIAVLYQLHLLGVDTGLPIEVLRSPDGRVSVSGMVATDTLKQSIDTRLGGLDGHELLDLGILSSGELKVPVGPPHRSMPVEAYEVAQPGFAADARIRAKFAASGLSGERLDAAVSQFSRGALQHAQRALQHAYALDRLGSSISAAELRTMRLTARQQWTGMVNDHAAGLETELHSLYRQLAEILPAGAEPSTINRETMSIDDPVQFAKIAGQLVRQVRDLNRQTGEFFTASGKTLSDTNLNASVRTIMDTIPLQQAGDVAAFAMRLGRLERDQKISAQTR
jgi:DNA-directed RNA polymerase specialized sigma24 family protein